MAVESPGDLAAFFSVEEFGVRASWKPAGKPATPVDGIFDHDFVAAVAGGIVAPSEESAPVFRCATGQIAGIRHGDGLEVEGIAYRVVGNQPDGTGVSLLILERV